MTTNLSPNFLEPPFDADWFARASTDLDPDGRQLLKDAAHWAVEHTSGLLASTGEPLAEHSAAVVLILSELGTDAQTRASALLTVLRPDIARDERDDPLFKRFGAEVLALVQGTRALLRLSHLAGQSTDQASIGTDQKEMQRKMLLAMAADLRIVLMRL